MPAKLPHGVFTRDTFAARRGAPTRLVCDPVVVG